MDSIHLIRANLARSEDIVLARIEEMRDHCMVQPTRNGGCHTLWVLGHLAYVEAQVIQNYMLGSANPLSDWAELFDGADVSTDASLFPNFDDVLRLCRDERAHTMSVVGSMSESDLDQPSKSAPAGAQDLFGTARDCLQYAADHWYMHKGHLADARRTAGIVRAWF